MIGLESRLAVWGLRRPAAPPPPTRHTHPTLGCLPRAQVYRGARKGRGLVVSPKDYSTKCEWGAVGGGSERACLGASPEHACAGGPCARGALCPRKRRRWAAQRRRAPCCMAAGGSSGSRSPAWPPPPMAQTGTERGAVPPGTAWHRLLRAAPAGLLAALATRCSSRALRLPCSSCCRFPCTAALPCHPPNEPLTAVPPSPFDCPPRRAADRHPPPSVCLPCGGRHRVPPPSLLSAQPAAPM